jgi:hypothetical protein
MSIEAMKLALEALEYFSDTATLNMDKAFSEDAITALRQAIEQTQKQKPYGWAYESHGRFTCNAHPIFWKTRKAETHTESFWEEIPLYRHPPQRQPLTDEQIEKLLGGYFISHWGNNRHAYHTAIARAIEAAHGIKGEA